jgi:iron complex transport system permease protein
LKGLQEAAPTAQTVAPPDYGFIRPVVTAGRVIRVILILSAVLTAVFIVSLMSGPEDVHPLSLIRHLFSEGIGLDATEQTILFSIRLPRILLAAIVGAALSSSGVIFQALLRNPLADPYILGISGGAAVGAIIGIMAGGVLSGASAGGGTMPIGVPLSAFLGAMTTIILLFGASARSHRDGQGNTLLLTGVIINAFFSAIIMFLIAISRNEQVHSILFWLMGDLSLVEGGDVLVAGAVLAGGFIVMMAHARSLNLLVTGEETAMQLGVHVAKVRKILLVTASTVTAVAVSVSGTIGFVGLIIPHILRLLLGPDHRLLLPASILFGAAFLVGADTIARTAMAPVELPVGVVTALCGAPYFIHLLRRRGI